MRRTHKMINGVEHKKCGSADGCGKFKPITEFWAKGERYNTMCISCCKAIRTGQENRIITAKPRGAEKYLDGSWWKTGRFGFHFRWNEFINDWVRADYQDYRERVL